MSAEASSLREVSSFLASVPGRHEAALGPADEALLLAVLTAQSLQLIAEEALRRQTEALALAAHELRNPLMPIRTVATLLAKGIGVDDLGQLASVLERQVTHMSRLVDDLLDASRVATGKLHMQCSQVDMAHVFDHVVDICKPAMDVRQQRFVAYVPDRRLTVHGDVVRLTQLFTNLVQNASKYTPVGGEIVLACRVDAVDGAAGGFEVEASIADNGIGISPEVLPMIFEPFVQDPHAVGFAKDGLGIGLTLVRELVRAHGGTVTASSPGTGLGSEFVVRLPLA